MRKIREISNSATLYSLLENDHSENIIADHFITGSDKVFLAVEIQFNGKLLDN